MNEFESAKTALQEALRVEKAILAHYNQDDPLMASGQLFVEAEDRVGRLERALAALEDVRPVATRMKGQAMVEHAPVFQHNLQDYLDVPYLE